MKEKTLDEKKVFVPRRIGKNEKINEVFFTYEDVKQFIKEILDEIMLIKNKDGAIKYVCYNWEDVLK